MPTLPQAYRSEAERCCALPQHEFGLDVLASVGNLRYGEHRSIPEIHQALCHRGLDIAQRTVTNLLDRCDESPAVTPTDDRLFRELLAEQDRVILAVDVAAYSPTTSTQRGRAFQQPTCCVQCIFYDPTRTDFHPVGSEVWMLRILPV